MGYQLEVILWTAWVLVVVCLLEIVSKADILVLCSLNLKELKLLHKNSMLPAKKWKSLPTIVTNAVMKQPKKVDSKTKLFLLRDLTRKKMKKFFMILMKESVGLLILQN